MAAICQWFWDEEKDFMKDGIQKLVEHWQKCIEVGGDYVENRLCTVVNKGERYIYFFVSLKHLPSFIFI